MKHVFLLLISVLLILSQKTVAIDINDFGDFSSRSVIMSGLKAQEKLSAETKEILEKRKLSLTSDCLVREIKKSNFDNVKILIEAGVNPNLHSYTEYPIYAAAKKNNFEILKYLYEHNAKIGRGFYSELYEAVKNKNNEMAQFLIDHGANVNYQDAITNNTILYLAIKNDMLDIAKQLAKKGAQADRKTVLLLKKKKIDLTK